LVDRKQTRQTLQAQKPGLKLRSLKHQFERCKVVLGSEGEEMGIGGDVLAKQTGKLAEFIGTKLDTLQMRLPWLFSI
jgi:hypothetical protein